MPNRLIHFYVSYSNTPKGDPLDQALVSSGASYRLFGRKVSLKYHHRWQLILLGLPRLIWMAFGSAWNSLVRESVKPDVVLVGSHFEALAFVLVRLLSRHPFKLVYLGFIYTGRDNQLLRWSRGAYFSFVFDRIDAVVCYSTPEVERYGHLFPRARQKFFFVPYGLHVPTVTDPVPHERFESGFLSAGRSGRDYRLLTQAFAENGLPLKIVCDLYSMQDGCATSPNIEWLTNCHSEKYLAELHASKAVVVPLSVDDISAGQMVMLQAMAFGKPVIATRTSTLLDYATEDSGVMLVSPGAKDDLLEAVNAIASDPVLAADMSAKARRTYLARHTPVKFVENLLSVIDRL